MPTASGATEILPPSSSGRTFSATRSVRLGDVDSHGVLRLDATARFLQDIASDDAADAGLDEAWGWMVRRTMIEVRQPANRDEVLELTTHCTGAGRSWAERTTTISGSAGADIASVSIWVQVSAESGRPSPLTDQFQSIYGVACRDRKVSARLMLDGPPAVTESRPWAVRRTDIDPFDHVNNAANWAFLEEVVGGTNMPRAGVAEMEFAGPVQFADDAQIRSVVDNGGSCSAWLMVEAVVRSSARWVPRR